jgi:hypothetical protein
VDGRLSGGWEWLKWGWGWLFVDGRLSEGKVARGMGDQGDG